jgi:DNA polymerase-3 subunit beta
MKFSCDRDVIINEISVAQEIISSRNSLSILSNVFLEAKDNELLLIATDLKVSFETKIPVEAKEAGTTTVFCDKLLGILRSLPSGLIEFENTLDSKFIIRPVFKKIDFRLKSISAEKFPEIQSPPQDLLARIAQKDFIEMITQTVFAVSDDETRYFMNGVLLEKADQKLIMVATDGRRLSYIAKDIATDIPDFRSVIIPPKILNLFRKQASGEGELEFAITDKQIFILFDNQKLASSLIEGQFPNHKRVIPESQTYSILVDRLELSEALKRVSLMVEKSKRVFVQVSENAMVLQSEETEIGHGSEELFCEYQGPENKMALNVQYMSDPLKVLADEKVSIRYTETNKAISIFPVPERDYFHIIMPMSFD